MKRGRETLIYENSDKKPTINVESHIAIDHFRIHTSKIKSYKDTFDMHTRIQTKNKVNTKIHSFF